MHVSNQPKSTDYHQTAVNQPLQWWESSGVTNSLLLPHTDVLFLAFYLTAVWKEGGRKACLNRHAMGFCRTGPEQFTGKLQANIATCQCPSHWGKRCTPKYRASREQQKMLPVKEAGTQKTPSPSHAHVKFLFTHLLLMSDAEVYYQYEESWCILTNKQIHPTGVIFNILYQAVQRNHILYQHSITGSSPVLDQEIADLSGARYWRQEWLQESKHLLKSSKHRAALKPWVPKAKPLLGRG